jgi:UPF0755 protein
LVRKGIAASSAGVVFFGLLIAGYTADVLYHRPAEGRGRQVRITIEKGEPFSRVFDAISAEGLIVHPRAMRIYAYLMRYDRRVQAGTYQFTFGETARDILGKMVKGDVLTVPVTIPEGFMHQQIAGVLASRAGIDSTAFAALHSDRDVLAELGIEGPTLEGYLFPETYMIPWGTQPREIARMMVDRLRIVFQDRFAERARRLGMTRLDILTLASIVEAETRLPEEFPRVSAVYHNRLKKGMRLEADPTVAYAMGGYKGRLYYKDLEIDSPYNTYKHEGLPPGPICNPGERAIMATLHPDTAFAAMYFVARGNGSHIFSLTLQEHLAAVRKVRNARAANR